MKLELNIQHGTLLAKDEEFSGLMKELGKRTRDMAQTLSCIPLALRAQARSLEVFFEMNGPEYLEKVGLAPRDVILNSVKIAGNSCYKFAHLPIICGYLGRGFTEEEVPRGEEMKRLIDTDDFIAGVGAWQFLLVQHFNLNVEVHTQILMENIPEGLREMMKNVEKPVLQ